MLIPIMRTLDKDIRVASVYDVQTGIKYSLVTFFVRRGGDLKQKEVGLYVYSAHNSHPQKIAGSEGECTSPFEVGKHALSFWVSLCHLHARSEAAQQYMLKEARLAHQELGEPDYEYATT